MNDDVDRFPTIDSVLAELRRYAIERGMTPAMLLLLVGAGVAATKTLRPELLGAEEATIVEDGCAFEPSPDLHAVALTIRDGAKARGMTVEGMERCWAAGVAVACALESPHAGVGTEGAPVAPPEQREVRDGA